MKYALIRLEYGKWTDTGVRFGIKCNPENVLFACPLEPGYTYKLVYEHFLAQELG
jgi:hypothetical protein